LADSAITQAQARQTRLSHLRQAIKDGKLTGKIPQQWSDKTAQESLHWLLRNIQYQQARRHRSTAAMPKSLQPSSVVSLSKPENLQTKSQTNSVTNQPLSALPSLHQPLQTQTETMLSITETPSPVASRPVSSYGHGVKRSFWFAKNNSHPRSPAAAELYRVFLVTKSTITRNVWPVMVSDLPSHGIDGSLSDADWSEWIRMLTHYCQFNGDTQQIQTSDTLFAITDCRVWQTVILMYLEDLAPSGEQHITGSLQVHFSIAERPLEIEHANVPRGLDNPANDPATISESDISDVSSTDIRIPKRLRSTTVEENPVPGFPADTTDKSPVPAIPIPQQPLIISHLFDTTQETQHESISVDSSSFDEDEKMQDDISGRPNSKTFIDEIITRATIATEDDLDQELNVGDAIHTATKRCEQFSEEIWKNFQTFFMLPKGGTDGTDPDVPISFPGLSRCPYPHQLYGAFVMLIKGGGSSGGGYLGDEMGVGKTMAAIMLWILNAWLVQNKLSVERARTQPEHSQFKHLPENAPENTPCPSQHIWPFLCRCVNSPFSAKQFEPRDGATLVVSPKSLLLSWAQQWSATIPNGQDKHNIMKLRLFIGHGDVTRRVLEKIGHPDIQLIAEHQDNIQAKEDMTSGCNDHRYMIITTPQSFETRVHPYTDRLNPNVRQNFYNDHGILARLKWGLIIRDEFHLEKGSSSTTIRVFRKLTRRQDETLLPTWLLSGTMFDKGPIDLQHWMDVLETDTWAQHPSLKHAMEEPYKILSTRVQRLVNKPPPLLQSEKQEMERLATNFSAILEELAICRTAQSTWFGKPIIKLPPHTHHDYVCKIPDEYLAYFNEHELHAIQKTKTAYWKNLEAWKRNKSEPKPEMSLEGFFKQTRISRIGSIFPAILPLVKEMGLQLTDEEFKQNKWHMQATPAPYFEILDKLVQSSSKCKVVENILQEMANSTDYAGRKEKLILISNSPVVVRILVKVCATQS
jgi:SNF2-related domain